jgi:hypothetical protein
MSNISISLIVNIRDDSAASNIAQLAWYNSAEKSFIVDAKKGCHVLLSLHIERKKYQRCVKSVIRTCHVHDSW